MKSRLLLILAPLLLARLAAAQPFSEFTFDQPSPLLELRNRAHLGEPGSGVSGRPGDRAYVGPVEIPPVNTRGGPVAICHRPLFPHAAEAFTFTFWYRLELDQPELMVAFNAASVQLLLNERGLEVRVENSLETPRLIQFQPGAQGPYSAWRAPGVWIFCAVSWDRHTNTATFHQGTDRHTTQYVRAISRPGPVPPSLPRVDLSRQPEVIGNNHVSPAERPLAGRLDNLRFFTAVLDAETIETIRRADLAHSALRP